MPPGGEAAQCAALLRDWRSGVRRLEADRERRRLRFFPARWARRRFPPVCPASRGRLSFLHGGELPRPELDARCEALIDREGLGVPWRGPAGASTTRAVVGGAGGGGMARARELPLLCTGIMRFAGTKAGGC